MGEQHDSVRSYWHHLRQAPLLVAVGILSVLIELVLTAADLQWIGTRLWRSLAYQYGAFWPGLLYSWQPNFNGQPVTMFASYAFLHGGPGHLAGNMITLFALGAVAVERVGQARTLAIYALSALGGAALFGLMTASPQPMVGASGALFGLAGAWQFWVYDDTPDRRQRLLHLGRAALLLVLLNVLLWWLMDGRLAWQTHLGGFLCGWVAAVWLTPDR